MAYRAAFLTSWESWLLSQRQLKDTVSKTIKQLVGSFTTTILGDYYRCSNTGLTRKTGLNSRQSDEYDNVARKTVGN